MAYSSSKYDPLGSAWGRRHGISGSMFRLEKRTCEVCDDAVTIDEDLGRRPHHLGSSVIQAWVPRQVNRTIEVIAACR